MEHFKSAETAFLASPKEVMNIPGFGKGTAGAILLDREEALQFAGSQIERLTEDIRIVTFFDEEYPRDLKRIYSPPPLLFVRGNI